MSKVYENISDFIASCPPGAEVEVAKGVDYPKETPGPYGVGRVTGPVQGELIIDDASIYCPSDSCEGRRNHSAQGEREFVRRGFSTFLYLQFKCRNCRAHVKTVSVRFTARNGGKLTALKLGEYPPFGEPTPKALLKLVGDEHRKMFLSGRRCENQGLGIGAWVYYRRIVELTRDKLAALLEARERESAAPSDERLARIEEAKKETQFSRSLGLLKESIPDSLIIAGVNPLAQLHDLLSEGVHSYDDATCLENARRARLVLSALLERMELLRKQDEELRKAISAPKPKS